MSTNYTTSVGGIGNQIIISDYDLKPYCPHCNSSDLESIGQLHIEGAPKDTYRCKNCSSAFTLDTPGINNLVSNTMASSGTDNVTFTTTSTTVDDIVIDAGGAIETTLDYNSQNQIDMLKNGMISLNSTIQNLASQIYNLIEENKRIMEERKADPMMGLRKSIFDFNLE